MSTGGWGTLAGTPVLLYHSLVRSGQEGDRFGVSAENFRWQLRHFVEAKRSPAGLLAFWAGEPTGARSVLTFDDGNDSDYHVAFPALSEAGLSATFFVNPGTVGQQGFLSWEQIQEMHRAGQAFGSHGQDHVDLSLLPARPLEEQLRRSKKELEDHLGAGVDFLAAPYGLVNRRVVETAKAEGYKAVCTSRPWPAKPGGPTIGRVVVRARTGRTEFWSLVVGDPWPYVRRTARSAIAHIPTQVLLRLAPDRLGVRRLEPEGSP